ncbi:SWIM zinc finger family protein [Candidatus Gracilibacteria bacterium]|nr:SWIM zinc finger family protein [Candidatus Gracilibacteria bacterium]
MQTHYTLQDIKHSSDKKSFEKAIQLYESGKILQPKETERHIEAVVAGTQNYDVFVDKKDFMHSDCNCYLGQQGVLCKHIIALALFGVKKGVDIPETDQVFIDKPVSSGVLGDIDIEQFRQFKIEISQALRYIKAYHGPSKKWFEYQDSLSRGCMMLAEIFSALPVGESTAQLVVSTLLKLDTKLSIGGVDDSDGVLGNFIEESVQMLCEYAEQDHQCTQAFRILHTKETCFGWEEPLLKYGR